MLLNKKKSVPKKIISITTCSKVEQHVSPCIDVLGSHGQRWHEIRFIVHKHSVQHILVLESEEWWNPATWSGLTFLWCPWCIHVWVLTRTCCINNNSIRKDLLPTYWLSLILAIESRTPQQHMLKWCTGVFSVPAVYSKLFINCDRLEYRCSTVTTICFFRLSQSMLVLITNTSTPCS